MDLSAQSELFNGVQLSRPPESGGLKAKRRSARAGTFTDNMRLPIHRWYRYSAGFSAEWVEAVLQEHSPDSVLDPFAGSGTVALSADRMGIRSLAVEAHPFVARIAEAKLAWAADTAKFTVAMQSLSESARVGPAVDPGLEPALLRQCFTPEALGSLLRLRQAAKMMGGTLDAPIRSLMFLAITSVLRACSHVGTAQWQYVLPAKQKAKVAEPYRALEVTTAVMTADMQQMQASRSHSLASLALDDARTLVSLPEASVDLVVTSPPYPNNYDYADATRLEMSFWGEISSWSDLHASVRRHLVCSNSQHSALERWNLDQLLLSPELASIHAELALTCLNLADERTRHGGKKTYHTMVAAYFLDMSRTMQALRRVVRPGGSMCWVVGDSAPYGVHVPVEKWLGQLAIAAGFQQWSFEKMRDRNIKWKNRKHRVPLHEGRLWIRD